METLIDVVRAIRNIRAEKKVEPAQVHRGVRRRRRRARRRSRPARRTSRRWRACGRCTSSPTLGEAPRDQVATAVLEGVTAVVPLAGLFDVDAERARLEKLIADAEAEAGRIEAKLNNEDFRARRRRRSSRPRRSDSRPCGRGSRGLTAGSPN